MAYTYIDEYKAIQQYKDYLDEVDEVSVIGISFLPSRVLEELDPIAFNCGFSDWLDMNELTIDETEDEESEAE